LHSVLVTARTMGGGPGRVLVSAASRRS
jgi:hypothetical protein